MSALTRTAAILFSAGQIVSLSANAATILATEALNQFNLIVFDDSKSTSDVDGRTFVGGNLSGGNYGQHPASTPASAYAGLTVGGTASGLNVNGFGIVTGGNLASANINSGSSVVLGNASSVNFNGLAYVAGSATASNFNGGHMTALAASAAAANAADAINPAIIKAELTGLSQQLSVLGSTGSSVAISGSRATFNAVADANGLAVFDLSGSARTVGAISVWNFYNATDLLIKSEFGGVVLAPDANLTNLNNIEGTVVVNSLTQKGEIHLQPFSGDFPDEPPSHDVPEPGLLSLVLAGLGAIAYRRTRRTA